MEHSTMARYMGDTRGTKVLVAPQHTLIICVTQYIDDVQLTKLSNRFGASPVSKMCMYDWV
jgi:hypothetical protein